MEKRELVDNLYREVDENKKRSLYDFRKENPPRSVRNNDYIWEYIVTGEGKETLLFLHGMAGYYDIWWQQIEYFREKYRVISVTYPPVKPLEEMADGVMNILAAEKVNKFIPIGSSMGGYLAQYLVRNYPSRVISAVFGNTFPPNDIIAKQNRLNILALPLLPEFLVMKFLLSNIKKAVYPASGHDTLTLAFLSEVTLLHMDKKTLINRFYCITEKFETSKEDIPLMIIESDNDPLVGAELRRGLRESYPGAFVHTFNKAGHFPFLNRPDEYNEKLEAFLEKEVTPAERTDK